jgi:hypothetical protein
MEVAALSAGMSGGSPTGTTSTGGGLIGEAFVVNLGMATAEPPSGQANALGVAGGGAKGPVQAAAPGVAMPHLVSGVEVLFSESTAGGAAVPEGLGEAGSKMPSAGEPPAAGFTAPATGPTSPGLLPPAVEGETMPPPASSVVTQAAPAGLNETGTLPSQILELAQPSTPVTEKPQRASTSGPKGAGAQLSTAISGLPGTMIPAELTASPQPQGTSESMGLMPTPLVGANTASGGPDIQAGRVEAQEDDAAGPSGPSGPIEPMAQAPLGQVIAPVQTAISHVAASADYREISLPGEQHRPHVQGEVSSSADAGQGAVAGTSEPFMRAVPSVAPEQASVQPDGVGVPSMTPQQGGQSVQVGALPVLPDPAAAGDKQAVIQFRPDKIAREMGLEIARHVSAGSDELLIRLDPAELGRINIRLSLTEQGHLRATVGADAPIVLDALRTDISELNRALEQAGVRTDSQSFRFDRGGGGGEPGGQWQQRYREQQAAARQGDTSSFAAADEAISYRPVATNGRINMMA